MQFSTEAKCTLPCSHTYSNSFMVAQIDRFILHQFAALVKLFYPWQLGNNRLIFFFKELPTIHIVKSFFPLGIRVEADTKPLLCGASSLVFRQLKLVYWGVGVAGPASRARCASTDKNRGDSAKEGEHVGGKDGPTLRLMWWVSWWAASSPPGTTSSTPVSSTARGTNSNNNQLLQSCFLKN